MIAVLAAAAALGGGFTGLWTDGKNFLEFRPANDHLRLEGDAIWPGREPAFHEDGSQIFPHMGGFSGYANRSGRRFRSLSDPEDECKIWGELSGDTLIVQDNYMCGANNVSFKGAYHRAPIGVVMPEPGDEPTGYSRWAHVPEWPEKSGARAKGP